MQTSTSWRHPLPQVVNLAGVREPSTHRRLLAAEMVSSGLRLHITATLLGHLSLDTTRGYTAIFPEEVVAAHQQFIERRRATRSGADLRTATGEEWAEVENHLLRRKIARVWLPRIEEMTANAIERLAEAKDRVWLDEVATLEARSRSALIEGQRRPVTRWKQGYFSSAEVFPSSRRATINCWIC